MLPDTFRFGTHPSDSIIYYPATAAAQIYLLTIYGKGERSDIDRETLRRIANKLEILE